MLLYKMGIIAELLLGLEELLHAKYFRTVPGTV